MNNPKEPELLLDLYYYYMNPEIFEILKQKYKDNNEILKVLNKCELERLNKIKEFKNEKET